MHCGNLDLVVPAVLNTGNFHLSVKAVCDTKKEKRRLAGSIVLIGTGSELALVEGAASALGEAGIAARVVSMPCTERFDAQTEKYRRGVLGPVGTPRLAVEAGATGGWWRYVGERGDVVGLDRFGESAPAGQLFEKFGFTVDAVAARARQLLGA